MAKLTGNLRITTVPATAGARPYYEVLFVPYAGRLATKPVKAGNYDELVAVLMDLKLSEDDAMRWAGKVRSQGVVLIASVERTDTLLRERGLLA
jgi:hypothetical protein